MLSPDTPNEYPLSITRPFPPQSVNPCKTRTSKHYLPLIVVLFTYKINSCSVSYILLINVEESIKIIITILLPSFGSSKRFLYQSTFPIK